MLDIELAPEQTLDVVVGPEVVVPVWVELEHRGDPRLERHRQQVRRPRLVDDVRNGGCESSKQLQVVSL